jgi:hypothetical protein
MERVQVCIDVDEEDLKNAQKELQMIPTMIGFETTALEYLVREAIQDYETRYKEIA